jgi:hypothetical protein
VPLEELREHPVLAVDLNVGHLAAWAVTADGNARGGPVTVPLILAGLPRSQRDGRVRAAISTLIGVARQHGCHAIAVENLDFGDARDQAPRQPLRRRKTVTADREHPPDQAAHDRSGPPDSQDYLLLSQLGTVKLSERSGLLRSRTRTCLGPRAACRRPSVCRHQQPPR